MESTDIEVRTVDPYDDAALATYHRTFSRGSEAGRIDPTTWTLDEVRVNLRNPESAKRFEVYIAWSGDVPVGAGDLVLSLKDNTSIAEFDFAVVPEHRRRGAGAALFDHVAARARAENRSVLTTEINVNPRAGGASAVETFLTGRGLTLRNTELRRQQKLPVPGDRLDSLAAKAAEKTDGYRIRSWSGSCPQEYAAQYAYLKGLLMSEAPTGSLDYEQEVWDVERLRELEARLLAQGRTVLTSVAVAPDGTLAGHTQLIVQAAADGAEENRAYQNDTLVLSTHRGHRLGLALKVTNLRALQSAHPNVNRVDTWNAEQNGPMVAVNEELGFEIIEVCQEWQGPLPGLTSPKEE